LQYKATLHSDHLQIRHSLNWRGILSVPSTAVSGKIICNT
jgi:hypothetical protein